MSKSKVCDCLAKIMAMPAAAWVILGACIGALGFAFTLQYGFDVHPCVLCLWQRVPFGLCAALAVAALIWRPYDHRARILLGICAALFFINTGLAFFHTGVEQHWWAGTSGCAVTPLHAQSVDDLRTQILNTVLGHCDQISWTFLGLSMANWNIPFSLLLAIFVLGAAACPACRPKK
jgi:disulfide bond formation protein DsbB